MSDPKGPRAPGEGDAGARSGDVPTDPPPGGDTDHGEGAGDAPAASGGVAARPDPGSDGEQGWALGQTEWVTASKEEEEEERPDRKPMLLAFVVGALAGMVVMGLVWASAKVVDDSDQASTVGATSTSATATDAEPSQEPTDAGVPSEMRRCRQSDAELTGILLAATPAMDQWEIHIGAMNKLVVGAITLQQANDFWNQTRVGAKRNLERFGSAERRVPFAGSDCPAPTDLAEAPPKLRACAELVAQDRQTLEAARTAIGTWATYVRHMEMLRMGHMSPAAATRMWLASWRQGVEEVRAYRDAAREAQASAGC